MIPAFELQLVWDGEQRVSKRLSHILHLFGVKPQGTYIRITRAAGRGWKVASWDFVSAYCQYMTLLTYCIIIHISSVTVFVSFTDTEMQEQVRGDQALGKAYNRNVIHNDVVACTAPYYGKYGYVFIYVHTTVKVIMIHRH